MATVTVSPIHFEDYSGVQFERLVFAYHVRAGWHDLIWHGQSGGDQGRDVSGIELFDGQPARKTIIQCANSGARQGSCRLIHAAKHCLSGAAVAVAATTSLRSGFSVTTPTRDQLRVARVHRRGFRSRASRYSA